MSAPCMTDIMCWPLLKLNTVQGKGGKCCKLSQCGGGVWKGGGCGMVRHNSGGIRGRQCEIS